MACGHVRRAFGSENDSIRRGMSRDIRNDTQNAVRAALL
jgi:hypothetical protein